MAEYAEYLCIKNNTLWRTAPHQQKQRNFAYTVTLLCDQSRLYHDVNHIKEHYIKPIQLMLLNNRTETRSSVEDAFSPLVQALINKTSGIDGWNFSKITIQNTDGNSSFAINI